MNKLDLEPHQVVLDTTLRYSPVMPRLGEAAVLSGNLIFATRNHRGEYLTLSFPIHFSGDPFDGDEDSPPRFVLTKIWNEVWKLSPSVLHPSLHCFVTVVGVPEDISMQWKNS